MNRFSKLSAFARRLRRDQSGLALLEFAFSAPIVLSIGMYGIEVSNLALMNMRVSQSALNIADNASRLGLTTSLNTQQLRETDINDLVSQIRQQTGAWGLTTRGRVTITSLEEKSGNQIMHWQRCVGLRNGTDYKSHYDKPGEAVTPTDGSDTTAANDGVIIAATGMGPAGAKVVAPPNSGVIFVEVNYEYNPVVSDRWLPAGTTRLSYIASFIVRDRRDFTQIFNPTPSVATNQKMTCDRYTT